MPNRRQWLNHHVLLVTAFSACYFCFTLRLAGLKLLWYDELFTYHIARLPAVSDIWLSLVDAIDLNPPLSYLAARTALNVFGDHPVALRLPSVLGLWLLSVCLYGVVARRVPAPFACLAMLFPQMTQAADYAYEARPYGIVLGCCGVALLCWQAADGVWRRVALFGLCASLAAALSAHYYAVLLFVPLGLAELTRWVKRRRVDLALMAAATIALAPLIVSFPLIRAAKAYYAATAPPSRDWGAVLSYYSEWLLPFAFLPLTAVLLLLCILPRRVSTDTAKDRACAPNEAEWVLAVGLAALPILLMLAAKTATGAYAYRYVLSAVAGCALLVAFVVARRTSSQPAVGYACAALFFAAFGVREVGQLRHRAGEHEASAALQRFLARHTDVQMPVVVADPRDFLALSHYAPPELAARLVYVADPVRSVGVLRGDTHDKALLALARWVPLNVIDYQHFVAEQPQFLVYGKEFWVSSALIEDGTRLEVRAMHKTGLLFDATAPDNRPRLSVLER